VGSYAGDLLAYVAVGKVKDIVMTSWNSNACAILLSGEVKCWGVNSKGTAGLGTTFGVGYPLATGTTTLMTSLVPIDLGDSRKVEYITMSGHRGTVCAKFESTSPTTTGIGHLGQYKCWGGGASKGLLGNDQATNKGDEPGEMGTALPYMITSGLATGPFTCYDDFDKVPN